MHTAKKILAVLLALVLCVGTLAACDSKPAETTTTPAAESTTAPAAETTAPAEETTEAAPLTNAERYPISSDHTFKILSTHNDPDGADNWNLVAETIGLDYEWVKLTAEQVPLVFLDEKNMPDIFFQPGGAAETRRIYLGEQRAASLYFHDDWLLVVTNERQLLRYAQDNTPLSQTDLHVYTNFYSNCVPTAGKGMNIHWDFTADGELVLNVFGLGNIIDCTCWDVRAYVLNYKAYDAQGDRLVCYIESQLGYFPRYTTAQVMELAVEQINGYTLSDELKTYYGIE